MTMPSISRSLRHLPRLPQARVTRAIHCSHGGVTPYTKTRPAEANQWLATAEKALEPMPLEAPAAPQTRPEAAARASGIIYPTPPAILHTRSSRAAPVCLAKAAQKQWAQVRQMQGNSCSGRTGGREATGGALAREEVVEHARIDLGQPGEERRLAPAGATTWIFVSGFPKAGPEQQHTANLDPRRGTLAFFADGHARWPCHAMTTPFLVAISTL